MASAAIEEKIRVAKLDLEEIMREADASGDAGNIIFEKLPYWPGNFGTLEVARSRKKDLTKVGVKG